MTRHRLLSDPEGTLADELAAHAHGRVPRAVRRRQILAEAEQLLGEVGYGEMQMDELARRVGVTKPVIYGLVGPKHEVFSEVMNLAATDLGARIVEATEAAREDDSDPLLLAAEAFFIWVAERAAAWGSLFSSGDTPAGEAVATIRERQARLLALIVSDRVSELDPDGPEIDAAFLQMISRAINSVFESLAAGWPDHPDVSARQLAVLATRLVQPGLQTLWETRTFAALEEES